MLLPKDHPEYKKRFVSDCPLYICKVLQFPILQTKGCTHSISGIQSPLLNGVFDCNSTVQDTEEAVKEITDFYFNKRIPHSWWTETSKEPNNLRTALEKKGIKCLGTFPGLCINPFDAIEPTYDQKNYSISIVNDDSNLQKWNEVISASFHFSKEVAQDYFNLLKNSNAFVHFAGKYKDEIVSTGSVLIVENESAYIYNMATKENFRRRGYAKAICYSMMQYCKNKNITCAALVSSPMAANLSPQIGFIEYSTFHIYA